MDYKSKYLKYKSKYLLFKNIIIMNGGGSKKKQTRPNNVIKLSKNTKWRNELPAVIWYKKGKYFKNNKNENINPNTYEQFDQYIVNKWILKTDIVLELGGRYGIVSCTINSKLNNINKKLHVVVEPDNQVIEYLKKNKKTFNAEFNICEKAISNQKLKLNINIGLDNFTSIIESKDDKDITITSNDFFKIYKQQFNVLVADCEGCLCNFFKENPNLLNSLELIIFEKDNPLQCNYDELTTLLNKNFELIDKIQFHIDEQNHYEVWKRVNNK